MKALDLLTRERLDRRFEELGGSPVLPDPNQHGQTESDHEEGEQSAGNATEKGRPSEDESARSKSNHNNPTQDPAGSIASGGAGPVDREHEEISAERPTK